jgi:hypothetical protein
LELYFSFSGSGGGAYRDLDVVVKYIKNTTAAPDRIK